MADIDIIIPIYNALVDVEQCILSNLANHDGLDVRLILVNDASGEETSEYLRFIDTQEPQIHLIESAINQGYSVSSNLGLEASTAPYVVLMNSDTIVTPNWLDRLLACANSADDIGIVSPVTNAAIWQSVPCIPDSSLISTVNLPRIDEINTFADRVNYLSYTHYPELPYIHGYCQFIKHEVLDAIGFIDAEAYPNGMGSELDFCYRAADAGYRSVVADDTFIFHGKAKSLNVDTRQECDWYKTFSERYDHDRRMESSERIKNCKELDALRDGLSFDLFRRNFHPHAQTSANNIAWLLNDSKNSTLLVKLFEIVKIYLNQGLRIDIFVDDKSSETLLSNHQFSSLEVNIFKSYEDESQLLEYLKYYDMVLANDIEQLSIIESVQSKYSDVLTVMITDKQRFEKELLEVLGACLVITEHTESAKVISAKTGAYTYTFDLLVNDIALQTFTQRVRSLWYSEKQRVLKRQASALMSLLEDALLYHRKDMPPMAFSKGIPPLEQSLLMAG